MTFVSYAQNYEDVRLWRALGHIERGCYLDIGAQDPMMDSVSKAFYDAGWRGAHVEATPSYAAALRENRPDEPVFEMAIGDHPGPMTFYEFPETGMSTGIAEIARAHSERGFVVRIFETAVVPLYQVFADFGAETIHWMKIDVEGMERDVIGSWGQSPARPWVLVIESVHPASHDLVEGSWLELVLARGYQEVAFDGLSRYFVADEHAALANALAAPPHIFDDFRVTRYHFSSQQVAAENNAAIHSAEAVEIQLQAELSAEQGRAAELLATAEALKKERENSEAVAAELISEFDAKLSSISHQIVESESELVAARLVIAERDNAALAAQALRADLDAKLSSITQQLGEKEARLAAARAEIGQLEAELLATAEALKHELENSEAVAAESFSEFDAKLSSITHQLVESESELVAARLAIAEREKAALAAEAIRTELDAKLSSSAQHLGVSELQLAAALAAIAQAEEAARNAECQLTDLTAKHEQANARAEALRKAMLADYADVKRSRDDLQHRVQNIEIGPSSRDAAIQALEARIATLEDDRDRIEQDLEIESRDELTSDNQSVDAAANEAESVDAASDDIFPCMDTEYSLMTLNDLLEFYDSEFVIRAYKLLLHRDAEPAGLQHYTRQLRRGRSKIRILADIARSAEARKVNAQLSGMRGAIRRQRMRDLILLRPLGARIFGEDREDDVVSRMRAIENSLSTLGRSGPLVVQHPRIDTELAQSSPPLESAQIEVADIEAPHAPAIPIVTMDADRMLAPEQWPTVTQGIFERHWPDHQAKLAAARTESIGQLWIVVAGETTAHVAAHTIVNLRALRDAAIPDVEFGTLGPRMSLGQNFGSIKDLATAVPADAIVMFIGPRDLIDIRLLDALVIDRAWNRDFILTDQTYQNNERVGLISFHGIDHYHLAYVDYFWSRFLVSAKALQAAVKSSASTLVEVSRNVVGKLESATGKLLHLQFPFIGNGELNVAELRQSRHDAMQQLSLDAPAAISGWDASVSVIINTKDGGYLLDGLVHQLLAITQVAEVLIVSNNSAGDYTLDLLDRLSQADRCAVFKYDQPFNFSTQNNIAARTAKGRFVMFLNDDISLIGTRWIEPLLADVDVEPSRIAGPLMLYPNQSIQHGGMYLGLNGCAGHTFRHQLHPHGAPMFELVAPRLVSCLTGACLLMKRSLFDDLNGFDEQLATGLQDVDLSLRALASGIELVFDPRAIIFHLESVSLMPTLADESVQRRREREYARFHSRWHSEIWSDRWHNRNFNIQDETLREIRIAN